jgi:ubiquinone/menaquinone biosynthesis C-methylase UbiE
MLELGCGVGSRLSALARAFPLSSGVGVELAANLVDFGRERAAGLGLADRVTYVHGDAQTYRPDGLFDLVTWSQFFFPESSRAGALATARRALRPGGWITAPVIWDEPGLEPGSKDDQDLAAELLLMDLWRVPPRTTAEVAAEFGAAGFVDVRTDHGTMAAQVRGRQPQPQSSGQETTAAPN